MIRSESAFPCPFSVAPLLARDHDFVRHVEQTVEAGTHSSERSDPQPEEISTQAPLLYHLAGLIAWCERIAPKLPVGKAARPLVAIFILLLLTIAARSALSEPSVELDAEGNALFVKIRIGPDDDVDEQFERAKRLAKARQPQLLGYRAPSRGPARNARSTYFAYLGLQRKMSVPARIGHWEELSASWSDGAVPAKSAPEWDAWSEWQAKSGRPECLTETNVYASLRSWRAQHEGVERAQARLVAAAYG